MELRHLRTFLAAAETLNISAAARRLNVTQPALSRQIRELELEVGQALFVRHPGGLQLTSAGAELREHGAKAMGLFDDTLRAARGDPARPPAHLRLCYPPTLHFWTRFMAPAVTKLEARHPGVSTAAREMPPGRIIAAFRAGEIDAAVLSAGDYPPLPGVTLEKICDAPASAVLAIDDPLAKKRQLGIGDLRGREIIGFSEEAFPGRDNSLVERCRAEGFEPEIFRAGESLLDGLAVGLRRGSVGIAANFGMKVFVPGVIFVPFREPGLTMPVFAASVEAIPEAGTLRELMAAEARRVIDAR